jgi:hypothetical protein
LLPEKSRYGLKLIFAKIVIFGRLFHGLFDNRVYCHLNVSIIFFFLGACFSKKTPPVKPVINSTGWINYNELFQLVAHSYSSGKNPVKRL